MSTPTRRKLPGALFDLGGAAHNVMHPDFGAVGNGVVNDQGAVDLAIAELGGGILIFPPDKTFAGTALTVITPPEDALIFSEGATIKDMRLNFANDRSRLHGGVIKQTLSNTSDLISVSGEDNILWGFTAETTDASSSVRISVDALRTVLDNWRIVQTGVADGINVHGSGARILNGYLYGFDDGIALKSTDAGHILDGLIVSNIEGENVATVLAVGTHVAGIIRNVVATGLRGTNASRLFRIKGGGVLSGGLVESFRVIGGGLTDPAGARYAGTVEIYAISATEVKQIRVEGLTTHARGGDPSGAEFAHVDIHADGAGSLIEGIHVRDSTFVDPFEGQAFGAAGTTGYPMTYGAHVYEANSGEVKEVDLEGLEFDGCAQHGVFLNCPSGTFIRLGKLVVRNYARSSTAFQGVAIAAGTVVRKVGDWGIQAISGTRPLALNATASLIASRKHVYRGTIAAGTADRFRWTISDRRTVIFKYEVVVGTAVVQSDVDYVTFTAAKTGVGTLFTKTTQATGGMALVANTPNDVSGNRSAIEDVFDKGEAMAFTVAHTGAGKELVDYEVIIHYAEV